MRNKPAQAEDREMNEYLPAGDFSAWLHETRNALLQETGVEVPCGDCKACCKSSYFIHIKPEEKETLRRIDKKLLFPAPGLPRGHKLLGYFENGQCPLLIDDKCSIYEHRSHTCRAYDCRIFSAAGIDSGDDDKKLVTEQVRRWRFTYPSNRDSEEHAAVKAAAKFIREHAQCFPDGRVPGNSSQLAIMAIKVYDVFIKFNERSGAAYSDNEWAQAIVKVNAEFEDRRISNSRRGRPVEKGTF